MKIPVGISSCLLGERVRFDGGHKQNAYIQQTLGEYFEFRSFCPEVAIGLGVPREPIHLIWNNVSNEIRCVSTVDASQDFTDDLIQVANEQINWQLDLCGYIFKSASPSCGMERVLVHKDPGPPSNDGVGIYNATVIKNFPDLPIEEEGRLGDSPLRENFVQRVTVMWRWKKLIKEGVTLSKLAQFHARHKLILMSHDRKGWGESGQFMAAIHQDNLHQQLNGYIRGVMKNLKIIATVDNHVNVLQHIQGFLKQNLDREDNQELVKSIERYRSGIIPLIVPITLLNHHFRRNPCEAIEKSWYMNPYQSELSLIKQV